MAADPFSPRAQEPDEPSRLRALGIAAFLMLATAFLYQAMDGIQRANEQAERRQRVAQSACRNCSLGDDADIPYEDDAAAIAADAADAAARAAADAAADAAARLHPTPVTAPTAVTAPTPAAATTAPTEPPAPEPLVPILAPGGKP